jgi:transposase
VAAVRRVRQQFRARGTLEAQTQRCGRKTLLTEPPRRARLQKLVADQPDATLAELGARLDRRFGTSTVDTWLRRLGLRRKKNAARRGAGPAGRGRAKKPVACAQRAGVPSARLVFVDESGADTEMTRLGGRSPPGRRLVAHIPHGHHQTSTLIAGVRLCGPCAPWVFAGAMDGEMFPPPCSPDFNPIENLWSKVKQTLRRSSPRTAAELLPAVATAFASVTAADCLGFLSHAQFDT